MNAKIEAKAIAVLRKLATCPLYPSELRHTAGKNVARRIKDAGFTDKEQERFDGEAWVLTAADVLAAREAVEALDAEPKNISIADSLAQMDALKAGMDAVIGALTRPTKPAPPAKPVREKKTLKGRVEGVPDESGEVQWSVVITEQSHCGEEFGERGDCEWMAPSGRTYRSVGWPEYYKHRTYVCGEKTKGDDMPLKCPGLTEARTILADFAAYQRHFNGGTDDGD